MTEPHTNQELSDADFDLYAGFYQGLAHAQGQLNGPLPFVWPDELMRRSALDPMMFRRRDFFTVVAELDDDGRIHYFETRPDGAGVIHCTEDATPDPAIQLFADDSDLRTAAGWLRG